MILKCEEYFSINETWREMKFSDCVFASRSFVSRVKAHFISIRQAIHELLMVPLWEWNLTKVDFRPLMMLLLLQWRNAHTLHYCAKKDCKINNRHLIWMCKFLSILGLSIDVILSRVTMKWEYGCVAAIHKLVKVCVCWKSHLLQNVLETLVLLLQTCSELRHATSHSPNCLCTRFSKGFATDGFKSFQPHSMYT